MLRQNLGIEGTMSQGWELPALHEQGTHYTVHTSHRRIARVKHTLYTGGLHEQGTHNTQEDCTCKAHTIHRRIARVKHTIYTGGLHVGN